VIDALADGCGVEGGSVSSVQRIRLYPLRRGRAAAVVRVNYAEFGG
jgi:hypothetical protein